MSGWATSNWPRRSRTSGTSRACRGGSATCSTWRRRISRRSSTSPPTSSSAVDDEMRHNELSTLEAEMVVEKKAVEDQRDADLEARAQKLEADMKELEDEGAKSDVQAQGAGRRRARNASAPRPRPARAGPARRDLDHLHQAGSQAAHRRRGALPRAHRPLRRVLHGRHGRGVDPEAHRDLRHRRRGREPARDHPQRQGPEEASCAQAAQGRRGVPVRRATRRWAWCSTPSR